MEKIFSYPPFVDIGNTESLLPTLLKFSRKVGDITKKSENNLATLVNNELIPTSFLDIPLLILDINPQDKVELLIKNIFVANIETLEKQTSMGALLYCIMIKKACEEISRQFGSNNSLDTVGNSEFKVSHLSRRVHTSEIDAILRILINDDLAHEIFNTAISLAGGDGQILVKNNAKRVETIIEASNVYTFKFGLDDTFIKNSNVTRQELRDPRLVIIDGFFEKPSEIERFLFYASQNSESIIIVARGFSEEVIQILAHNFRRSGTMVFPLAVPLDLYGANALIDLAYVSGNDIVSALKGDLISSVRVDDHQSIEKAIVFKNQLLIKETKQATSVKRHLKELKKKCQSMENDELKIVFEKRIKSLLPRHIEIKLGRDIMIKSKMIDHRMRKLLSIFNEICWHGTMEISKLLQNSNISQDEKKIFSSFSELGIDIVPLYSLKKAASAMKTTQSLLLHTGVYVVSNN